MNQSEAGTPQNPKVFISHASADKNRFVLGFAGRLRREAGVDAWVDVWEIGPGDSVVDRIFEEGIKQASVFIIVLSPASVDRPWVRAELNVGVVKRIEGEHSRLIPVVIDNLEYARIPEALRAIHHVRIKDLESYETEFQEIVQAVYGIDKPGKPALGPRPQFAQGKAGDDTLPAVPGLAAIDSLVLKVIGDLVLRQDEQQVVYTKDVLGEARTLDIEEDTVWDALRILKDEGYLKFSGNGIYQRDSWKHTAFSVEYVGMEAYFDSYLPDYTALVGSVGARILDAEKTDEEVDHEMLAQELSRPKSLIEHILERFRRSGAVTLSSPIGGPVQVVHVFPKLKRLLASL